MIFYTVCVICMAAFGLADELTLPVATCKKSLSDDYSNCLKNAIQEAWPKFAKGIPEFDFPSLEPLVYKNESIELNFNEIKVNINILNFTVIGLSNIRFDDVRLSVHDNNVRLQVDIFKKQLTFLISYVLKSYIASSKIQEKEGFCEVIKTNVKETWTITGRVTNDVWLVEDFETFVVDGNMKTHCTGLFSTEAMENLAAKLVSHNFVNLFRTLAPVFDYIFSPYLIDLSNRFVSKVPFSVLFP